VISETRVEKVLYGLLLKAQAANTLGSMGLVLRLRDDGKFEHMGSLWADDACYKKADKRGIMKTIEIV